MFLHLKCCGKAKIYSDLLHNPFPTRLIELHITCQYSWILKGPNSWIGPKTANSEKIVKFHDHTRYSGRPFYIRGYDFQLYTLISLDYWLGKRFLSLILHNVGISLKATNPHQFQFHQRLLFLYVIHSSIFH